MDLINFKHSLMLVQIGSLVYKQHNKLISQVFSPILPLRNLVQIMFINRKALRYKIINQIHTFLMRKANLSLMKIGEKIEIETSFLSMLILIDIYPNHRLRTIVNICLSNHKLSLVVHKFLLNNMNNNKIKLVP